ncbi:MAG: TetR/AcrR family transcriptional regulator [Clostridiales bacterium]|nr:TetR/AcrR family transcriptional regulator [Clostridiales bacterium]
MSKTTKGRIVDAAWRLFYERGFDETKIEDIVRESATSKGSFYHYFNSKDELLGSLAYLFDEKYAEIEKNINIEDDPIDILLYLNHELFVMIEDNIDFSLLSRLYSAQLMPRGGKELLDYNRYYYKLLNKIILRGRENGKLDTTRTAKDTVHLYAMCERAIIYDWCISGGSYSLSEYAARIMPIFLSALRAKK